MKKLNITKERYEKSRYFTKKYGKLEYVSESGKMFKTDKGKVLTFVKESYDNVMSIEKWIRSKMKSGELPGVEKFKGGRMPMIRFKGSNIRFNYVLQQIGLDSGDKSLWSDETKPFYPPKKLIEKIEDWFVAAPERQRIDVLLDALNKVYDKGGIFGKAIDNKLWLDIPNAFDEGEYIIYGKVEIPKIDVIQNLSEDYPDLDELDEDKWDDWLQSHKKAVAEMIEEMAWTYREYAESSHRSKCMEGAGATTSTGGHYATFLTDMVAGFLEKQRGIDDVEHGDDGILVTFSDGGQVVVSFETVQH